MPQLRYEKLETILQVALSMQGSATGLSLDNIQEQHEVSRRTAERIRDALLRVFPAIEERLGEDRKKYWRLPPGTFSGLVSVSAEELASLKTALRTLSEGKHTRTVRDLQTLEAKLKSTLKKNELRRIEPDLEALTEAEGLASRPRPRIKVDEKTVGELRRAILECRKVRLCYNRRDSQKEKSKIVHPYGFVWGTRHYLLGFSEADKEMRYFTLSNVKRADVLKETFHRRKFSLSEYTKRSFGVYQEKQMDVVWRFSPEVGGDAREFIFHPTQQVEPQKDGSLIVKFRAGGMLEMCWHLFKWGGHVEVVKPKKLRDLYEKLVREMMQALQRG